MNAPQSHCHSCGMPTEGRYCEYCVDDQGNLKPREEIRAGLTQWLASWGSDKNADYGSRADHYLASMPAWATD